MARVNLNTHDLIALIDSVNDSLLRSTSFVKIKQLEIKHYLSGISLEFKQFTVIKIC